ncbi:hypothetical protein SAMN04488030_1008 [Aliiroseovarius halocynthiae]|uniref:Alpha/beta hydrolase n=1 Tax=Aliiroseovarius halocynthiae TaxID=985055 RepID=A0A545SVE9_9RHOB|nr:hypothetical protein [Aliiroseovarius halocynthiae]TQV68938.1 hypothetical protein FIL88_05015 [Aliiroseovarius halocynthiae]SMR71602.1 hypothetical protein SAMN04488030_1008 [Aliiroseovarius halocynthiae]
MSNHAETSKIVRRRRVFYIPGYDPIHPRRYRELYRKEGATQAEISDYELDLIGRQGAATYGWQVLGRIGGHEVEAEFDVLVWSDIVRDSMNLNIAQTYLMMARTAWTYISTGALRRLMWLRKGPVIAALYPVVALVLQLLLAVIVGCILGGLTQWVVGEVSLLLGRVLGWAVALAVVTALLVWFRKIDNKLFIYYLMHDYSYSASTKGANPPALEARMAQFGSQIADALTTDVDEVLVIGHSSGAHLGVSILSDLLAQGRVPTGGPQLNFLTLGQVVPMVSFLPKAGRLRRDLHLLSQQNQIAWVDVTAPGDGCAFALCDPVSVSGVAPGQGKRWPLVFSAAFTQSLSPERWAALRWRFFRLHFQYLCAFDRPRDYDYFQITAGPKTLRDRYRDRNPSKSRIDVPASKYTSMVS